MKFKIFVLLMSLHTSLAFSAPVTIELLRETTDETEKVEYLHELWENIYFRSSYHDELVQAYLDLFRNTSDEKRKVACLRILWGDERAKEAHHDVLVQAYLDLFRNTSDEKRKVACLRILWGDERAKEAHFQELVQASLEVIRNTSDEANKAEFINALWWDKRAKEAHLEELVQAYLEVIRKTSNEARKDAFLQVLWYHERVKEGYLQELLQAYLGVIRNTPDEAKKLDCLRRLWNDEPAKEAYLQQLVQAYLEVIRNTLDEARKSECLEKLWKDERAKEAHLEELVQAYLDLFRNTPDEAKKIEYLSRLWNGKRAKEAYLRELVQAYLEVIRNTRDEANEIAYLRRLWNDERAKEAHLEELVQAHLEVIRKTPHQAKKIEYLRRLWDDERAKEAHLEELVTFILDYALHIPSPHLAVTWYEHLKNDANALELCKNHHAEDYLNLVNRVTLITESFTNFENALARNIMINDLFTKFVVNYWQGIDKQEKADLCRKYIQNYGEDHPWVQDLLLLLARDGNPHYNTIKLYADLLSKRKEPYQHHAQSIKIDLPEAERTLRFAIAPELFSYLPASQERLASLEDVDAILGQEMSDAGGHGKIDSARFKSYFSEPFTEESIMFQAMIQKFLTMGKAGKGKLCQLTEDMDQCQQGQNQAIWEHYCIESLPLPEANLKTVTDWLVRLQREDLVPESTLLEKLNMSRDHLLGLISNMLRKDHLFRSHLSDLKTKDAQKLKVLLGRLAADEKGAEDNEVNFLKVLSILKDLSRPEDFFAKLQIWCDIYEIGLPANKYGDQLTLPAFEGLIAKLNSQDVKERGEFAILQQQLRDFVSSPEFVAFLDDFTSEEGIQFKELVGGFVRNGWAIGLVNFMELAKESGLKSAISAFIENTKLDKDMPLTWESLKTTLLREFERQKRLALNAIVEKLTGQKHTWRPHDAWYVESLLGKAIGLSDAAKTPDYDKFYRTSPSVMRTSLQEMLDLFHQEFTPLTLINHLQFMMKTKQLSIIDSVNGANVIWQLLAATGREELSARNIDTSTIDDGDLVFNEAEKGAKELTLALLLTKLGILQEIDEDGHPK